MVDCDSNELSQTAALIPGNVPGTARMTLFASTFTAALTAAGCRDFSIVVSEPSLVLAGWGALRRRSVRLAADLATDAQSGIEQKQQ
jgi:hypothetical protein